MHPLDKSGWWTGEGKARETLRSGSCKDSRASSYTQYVETRVSIWRTGTAGQEMEVVVDILAFGFTYLLRLLNGVSTVDAYVLMLMLLYRKQTSKYNFPYNPPLNAAFPQNCHNSAFDIALLVILCITTIFLIWNLSVLFTDHYMAG